MAQAIGKISFDIEPIVKLACMNIDCRYNRSGTCNLKELLIGEDGKCINMMLKEKKEENKNVAE